MFLIATIKQYLTTCRWYLKPLVVREWGEVGGGEGGGALISPKARICLRAVVMYAHVQYLYSIHVHMYTKVAGSYKLVSL